MIFVRKIMALPNELELKTKIGKEAFWDYWRLNGKCGYCGSEQDRDGCSNPNCIRKKEIQK
jgi:hypothetical protein